MLHEAGIASAPFLFTSFFPSVLSLGRNPNGSRLLSASEMVLLICGAIPCISAEYSAVESSLVAKSLSLHSRFLPIKIPVKFATDPMRGSVAILLAFSTIVGCFETIDWLLTGDARYRSRWPSSHKSHSRSVLSSRTKGSKRRRKRNNGATNVARGPPTNYVIPPLSSTLSLFRV